MLKENTGIDISYKPEALKSRIEFSDSEIKQKKFEINLNIHMIKHCQYLNKL